MKEVEFNKEYYDEKNNTKFEFYYSGLASDNYEEDMQLDELLNHFTNDSTHFDMEKNVSYLRTVLKYFEENLLLVRFTNENNSEEVLYKQSNLFYYGKKGNDYEIEYDNETGIKANFPKVKTESLSTFDFESYVSEIKNVGLTLEKLSEIQRVELSSDERLLVEIYNLFYGVDPDFSDININIRFQNMLSILSNFGINIATKYKFIRKSETVNIPWSPELEEEISSLYPLGTVSVDKPRLREWPQKVVSAVGSTVKSCISNPEDFDKTLIVISKILWSAEYNFNSNVEVDKLVECSGRRESEIKYCMKLVKKINSKIDEK